MALDYYLHLTISMSPKQALESLTDQDGGLTWDEDDSCLFNEVVTITATESPSLTRSIIEEAFHFTPTLSMGFRFAYDTDYDTDYGRFKPIMLQSTMFLMEHAQAGVLLFNGETLVLQWGGGQLIFNSDYHMWDEEWLKSKLSIPFEHRPLPSPLL